MLFDDCDYLLLIGVGVVVFTLVNWLTAYLVPSSACQTVQQKWKWRNVATSLVHSVITAVWAPVAFYQAPEMRDDLIRTFNHSSHTLVCFSIGYFIYDAIDMLLYHRKKSTYELLIHHALVIICFGIAATTKQFVAYGALSLMIEINSVFLHTRQLFIITNEPKSSIRYKANALLNVWTFLCFRVLLLGWMTRWMTIHRDEIPLIFFTVGSIGLAVMVVMNIILFCRILAVDFSGVFRKQMDKKTSSQENTQSCSLFQEDGKQTKKIV